MILTRLTLTDFGVFRGRQTICLTPKSTKPIILFGGKNGAGKSSLLEAIRLCLYGQLAFGQRFSREAYLGYLDARIHANPNFLIQPKFASLCLEFDYADVDSVHSYAITRSWERRSQGTPIEHLVLQRDGESVDELESSHWQDFVRELIPPGISQLFFFDGEKIQHLAEDSSDQQTLSEAIKSLLGLDIIERLQTDMGVYTTRLPKSAHRDSETREIEALEQEIENAEKKLTGLKTSRAEHGQRISDFKAAIEKLEGTIASEGGAFARNREALIKKQAELKAGIKHCEESIKTECAGLLPFALIPKLCLQLKEQLELEEAAAQKEMGKRLLQTAREELLKRLADSELWKEISLPAAKKESFLKHFETVIRAPLEIEEGAHIETVHGISPSSQRQLLSWIDTATREVSGSMKATGVELESLHRELDRVETQFRKVPADDILKPLLAEMYSLHQGLADASKQLLQADEEIKINELRIADARRKHMAVSNQLQEAAGQASKIRLVHNVQTALDEYKGELLKRKITQIEEIFSECFTTLHRKKDALRKVRINPNNFSVTLYDKREQALPKEQLSAGEKQIYAVSMLWALGKTSGRPLPVIIDTPLARLDSDHRRLLIHNYFPAASHQTLILSTDTEVDQTYMNGLKRDIAHSYRLDFDPDEQSTKISPGYFWSAADEPH